MVAMPHDKINYHKLSKYAIVLMFKKFYPKTKTGVVYLTFDNYNRTLYIMTRFTNSGFAVLYMFCHRQLLFILLFRPTELCLSIIYMYIVGGSRKN